MQFRFSYFVWVFVSGMTPFEALYGVESREYERRICVSGPVTDEMVEAVARDTDSEVQIVCLFFWLALNANHHSSFAQLEQ